MDKTGVKAYFLLINDDDFPLDEVTRRLNIQPSEASKAGESLPLNLARHYLTTTWKYGVGLKKR